MLSLCVLMVKRGVCCCSGMGLDSVATSAESLAWLSAGSRDRPASRVSMSAEACKPEARRWSSTSIRSSAGGYVMWVDAAMAARSILCRAGAMASDSAAAPALPSPTDNHGEIRYRLCSHICIDLHEHLTSTACLLHDAHQKQHPVAFFTA